MTKDASSPAFREQKEGGRTPPIFKGGAYKPLTPGAMKMIHESSLELLIEVGIKVHSYLMRKSVGEEKRPRAVSFNVFSPEIDYKIASRITAEPTGRMIGEYPEFTVKGSQQHQIAYDQMGVPVHITTEWSGRKIEHRRIYTEGAF